MRTRPSRRAHSPRPGCHPDPDPADEGWPGQEQTGDVELPPQPQLTEPQMHLLPDPDLDVSVPIDVHVDPDVTQGSYRFFLY